MFPDTTGESGLYFCGSATSGCTEETCQPDYGCNCAPCQYLDHTDQEEKEKEYKRTKIASSMIDSWTWDSQPGWYSLYFIDNHRYLC